MGLLRQDGWPLGVLMVVGLLALIHVPTVLAARFERRPVWPYAPPDEPEPTAPPDPPGEDPNPYAPSRALGAPGALTPNPYAAQMAAAARDEGFRPLAVFRHGKGGMYRVRYDARLSPGNDVLAIIGGGTIAGIPVDGTWLITPLADGRRVVTLDNQSASEIDLTGLTDEALSGRNGFEKFLDFHRRRVAASRVPPSRYGADPLAEHRAYRVERVRRLVDSGYAVYVDPEQTTWRYSLKGSFVFAFRAYANGYRRVFWPDAWLKPTRPSA